MIKKFTKNQQQKNPDMSKEYEYMYRNINLLIYYDNSILGNILRMIDQPAKDNLCSLNTSIELNRMKRYIFSEKKGSKNISI